MCWVRRIFKWRNNSIFFPQIHGITHFVNYIFIFLSQSSDTKLKELFNRLLSRIHGAEEALKRYEYKRNSKLSKYEWFYLQRVNVRTSIELQGPIWKMSIHKKIVFPGRVFWSWQVVLAGPLYKNVYSHRIIDGYISYISAMFVYSSSPA